MRPPARVPNPPGHLLHVLDTRTEDTFAGRVKMWSARCVEHGCTVRGAWRARISDALAELHAHEDEPCAPSSAA